MNPVILYLLVGAAVGPLGLDLVRPDLAQHGHHIEAVTQCVLLFALFGAGLRLRVAANPQSWRLPARFAVLTFLGTLLLITGVAHVWLGLELPLAVLLAAILAPTDLPMASDLRLPAPNDGEVRTLLSSEGALGAVLAVPAALLALGMLGTHDLGRDGASWVLLDLSWSVAAGAVAGWLTGAFSWRKLIRPAGGREGEMPAELLAVGTIAVACGLAMLLRASPLAAVFAAGVALSHGGRLHNDARTVRPSPRLEGFTARLERFGGVAALLLLGALLTPSDVRPEAVVLALILATMIRPLAASMALAGMPLPQAQRRVAGWFGMRGVVSLYLLSFAVNHGLAAGTTRSLTGIVVVALITCIAVHELTMTPLLGRRVNQRA